MIRKQKKLSSLERDQISFLRAQGSGIRQIAHVLGRSPSTISEEIKRNSFGDHYVAIHAQSKAKARKSLSSKRHPLKNEFVYSYVLKRLRWGWSPEQIAGRLKLKYPNEVSQHLHHETIYRFIYDRQNKEKRLWEYQIESVFTNDRKSLKLAPSLDTGKVIQLKAKLTKVEFTHKLREKLDLS